MHTCGNEKFARLYTSSRVATRHAGWDRFKKKKEEKKNNLKDYRHPGEKRSGDSRAMNDDGGRRDGRSRRVRRAIVRKLISTHWTRKQWKFSALSQDPKYCRVRLQIYASSFQKYSDEMNPTHIHKRYYNYVVNYFSLFFPSLFSLFLQSET